jgi:6,7-dimethyl-8-ribityllumazine synthase
VTIVRTPGAFEIPQVTRVVVASGKYDAVICLGAVIRGATPHFEYVSGSATSGIAELANKSDIPVINGVLTTNDVDQAMDRAGIKVGNKGHDAALAAVEMATLLRTLRSGGKSS